MTGKGTTLVEELLLAADDVEALGRIFVQGGRTECGPLAERAAARLRTRAERVRELLDLAHKQNFNGGRRELARALTGADLGGAPEREGKP